MIALEPGGPAAQAGMAEEDLIVALGDQPITSIDDLQNRLAEIPVGIPAEVVLLRGGSPARALRRSRRVSQPRHLTGMGSRPDSADLRSKYQRRSGFPA